jgi:hypothetical protein
MILKKMIIVFLSSILITLVVGDFFFQRKTLQDIDIEAFNKGYQNLLMDDNYRDHKYYYSFILYFIYIEWYASDQQRRNLIGMSRKFEYHINYKKLSEEEKKHPKVLIHESWKICYVNFYLLSSDERGKIYKFLDSIDFYNDL